MKSGREMTTSSLNTLMHELSAINILKPEETGSMAGKIASNTMSREDLTGRALVKDKGLGVQTIFKGTEQVRCRRQKKIKDKSHRAKGNQASN